MQGNTKIRWVAFTSICVLVSVGLFSLGVIVSGAEFQWLVLSCVAGEAVNCVLEVRKMQDPKRDLTRADLVACNPIIVCVWGCVAAMLVLIFIYLPTCIDQTISAPPTVVPFVLMMAAFYMVYGYVLALWLSSVIFRERPVQIRLAPKPAEEAMALDEGPTPGQESGAAPLLTEARVEAPEFIPMTGEVTIDILRHNLAALEANYIVVTDKDKELLSRAKVYMERTVKDCETIDRLVAMGCNEAMADELRAELERENQEIYVLIGDVIGLATLMADDSEVTDLIDEKIHQCRRICCSDERCAALRELAVARGPREYDPERAAEEIARLKALTDNLLSGKRGSELVTISEIYGDEES